MELGLSCANVYVLIT